MKNKYEIRGDITIIFSETKKHGKQEILIDTSDLFILKNLDVTWYPYCRKGKNNIYARANIRKPSGKQTGILLHRLIMNPDENLVVDHINRNSLDNRRKNMRIVTVGQNNQNRTSSRSSELGVRGITYDKKSNKYVARVNLNRKTITYRSFETLEKAERYAIEFRRENLKYSTN